MWRRPFHVLRLLLAVQRGTGAVQREGSRMICVVTEFAARLGCTAVCMYVWRTTSGGGARQARENWPLCKYCTSCGLPCRCFTRFVTQMLRYQAGALGKAFNYNLGAFIDPIWLSPPISSKLSSAMASWPMSDMKLEYGNPVFGVMKPKGKHKR